MNLIAVVGYLIMDRENEFLDNYEEWLEQQQSDFVGLMPLERQLAIQDVHKMALGGITAGKAKGLDLLPPIWLSIDSVEILGVQASLGKIPITEVVRNILEAYCDEIRKGDYF